MFGISLSDTRGKITAIVIGVVFAIILVIIIFTRKHATVPPDNTIKPSGAEQFIKEQEKYK